MLVITCPFCGPRDEREFINGGPEKLKRAITTDVLSDADWVDFLVVTPNPLGPVTEEWWHVMGCSQWFSVTRNTMTHELIADARESDD